MVYGAVVEACVPMISLPTVWELAIDDTASTFRRRRSLLVNIPANSTYNTQKLTAVLRNSSAWRETSMAVNTVQSCASCVQERNCIIVNLLFVCCSQFVLHVCRRAGTLLVPKVAHDEQQVQSNF